MMTKREEKRALRWEIRRLERTLPDLYRLESSRRVANLLLASELYRQSETIFCFVGTAHEIDTRPVLEDILSGGKRLCVPLCTGPGVMEAREIFDLRQLAPGVMGILEPGPDTPEIPPEEINLAILPCVSCDRHGRRLGHGGGYYDRFLTRYHGASVLLCRERLLLDEIPAESHDRPVPLILTERGFYAIPV